MYNIKVAENICFLIFRLFHYFMYYCKQQNENLHSMLKPTTTPSPIEEGVSEPTEDNPSSREPLCNRKRVVNNDVCIPDKADEAKSNALKEITLQSTEKMSKQNGIYTIGEKSIYIYILD